MLSRVFLMLTMSVSCYAFVTENVSESARTILISGFNKLRSSLSLPDLVWNSTLAALADNYASQCIITDDIFFAYGESIFITEIADSVQIVNDAVTSWLAEVNMVDATWACLHTFPSTCGQYLQIVWRNTTSFGCAIAYCSYYNFIVCKYNPPRDIGGQTPYQA